ncbi:unnamed protein product [Lepeophtheirus salmonis]|uniref:(salmon louse) hypothetical protein n=1 Tax=Lepeophtheirus salmonis TaxID=72036 RepID=A0A7R8H2R6_LEPSM|nr:unnamed protein product [Lepeophtheirus salmonis]CAF2832843.1 unnamed protein product [Lepeophtheirus salmonis]
MTSKNCYTSAILQYLGSFSELPISDSPTLRETLNPVSYIENAIYPKYKRGGVHVSTHPHSYFYRRSSIPHLFPDKLVDICVKKVLELLLKSGEIIEEHEGYQRESEVVDIPFLKEYFYSDKLRKFSGARLQRKPSKKRIESFKGERSYLTKFLGFYFLFMLLCNERTNRFVVHSIDEEVDEEMQEFWISELADISYSVRVTGIGLLGLCGLSKSSGCRYLRDLILKHGNNCDTIVPKVIACLLRYLENLEVLDIHNLHEGIEYYYRGQGNGSEKLLEIVDVCPKLRTLKLTASEYLPSIGKNVGFLEACGSQIGSLEIDCPSTFMRAQDFLTIGRNCHLLENLAISHLKLETEDELTLQHEVEVLFPFLRSLKIQKIDHEPRVTKEHSNLSALVQNYNSWAVY